MASEAERMARASNYVLGLMNDEQREHAEHDLAYDPSFRDAVVAVAERMHKFDIGTPPENVSQTGWKAVAERLGDMPHMRPAPTVTRRVISAPRRHEGMGAHETGGARGLAIAIGLMIAFGLGYATGATGVAERMPISLPFR